MKNLDVFLVQELEIVTVERQCQYSSFIGRLEADQHEVCVSYNNWAPPP